MAYTYTVGNIGESTIVCEPCQLIFKEFNVGSENTYNLEDKMQHMSLLGSQVGEIYIYQDAHILICNLIYIYLSTIR